MQLQPDDKEQIRLSLERGRGEGGYVPSRESSEIASQKPFD
jgi:hypothetical protein